MRKTRRTSRVGEMLRDALVDVFRFDFKDAEFGMSSVTEVEVSPDLRFARVFVSGLDEKSTRDLIEVLRQRAGKIRALLGSRIRLRYTPELDFRFDDTSAKAGRIEELLKDARKPD